MEMDNHSPSQFELFPQASQTRSSSEKFRYQLRSVTVTPDNLVVVSIMSIMTFVFFFAVGVERGKTAGLAKAGAEQIYPLQNENNAIMSNSVQPATGVPGAVGVALEQPKAAPATKKQEVIDIEKLKKEAAPAQTAASHFTIQVASFKQKQNAQKEADNLKKVGYETFVVSKGTHAIVCVGRFLEKAEALSFSKKLQNKYGETLVRRL